MGAHEDDGSGRTGAGHDSVIGAADGAGSPAPPLRARPDHWPLLGLVGLLVLIFTGVTWFINGMVHDALGGAPAPAQPAADGSEADAPRRDRGEPRVDQHEAGPPPQEAARPHGSIQLRLVHHLPPGRLLVQVDGRTALSRPFTAAPGGTAGVVSQLLSVPAGRHIVHVSLLDAHGEVVAEAAMRGDVECDRVVALRAEHPVGTRGVLNLHWASPEEAGGSQP
jgi:hypothetical protein